MSELTMSSIFDSCHEDLTRNAKTDSGAGHGSHPWEPASARGHSVGVTPARYEVGRAAGGYAATNDIGRRAGRS